jgi:hypothetical protein
MFRHGTEEVVADRSRHLTGDLQNASLLVAAMKAPASHWLTSWRGCRRPDCTWQFA